MSAFSSLHLIGVHGDPIKIKADRKTVCLSDPNHVSTVSLTLSDDQLTQLEQAIAEVRAFNGLEAVA